MKHKLTRLRFLIVLVAIFSILVIYRFGPFTMNAGPPSIVLPIVVHSSLDNLSYSIKTSGCTMQQFDPFDSSVKKYIKKLEPIRCPGNPNFISTRDGIPFIEKKDLLLHKVPLEDVNCSYQEIIRELSNFRPDAKHFYGKKVPLKFGTYLDKEFGLVECSRKSNLTKVFHKQFLLNLIPKADVELRCQRASNRTSHNLSVLVLGLDSVSRLNFLRHLRQTGAFVRDQLKAFELFGYNKLGDNSFPNQVPLITGMNGTEVLNLVSDKFSDKLDLIWKRYAERGYRTMFVEETPDFGLFNHHMNGFHKAPADYYFRPLLQAIDHSSIKAKFGGLPCLGPRMQFEILLDYLAQFTIAMKGRQFFSYTWISEISHDDLNYAGYANLPFLKLFQKLNASGVLNNTAVIFLSDHGIRFGDIRTTLIGKYEERQPFAFVIFPPWFLASHPHVERSLRRNQMRLTTTFDIHATLMELLDFPGQPGPRTKYGLSLFHEIPEARTCADASIPYEWCTCQTDESGSVSPVLAAFLGQHFVAQINKWLGRVAQKCDSLKLAELIDVRTRLPSQGEVNAKIKHYWVTLKVAPGGGIFEATLHVNELNGSVSVLEGVSRLNTYAKSAYCIKDRLLEKFCNCKK
ncbi:uncharacterized protein ISCGN_009741 [Ixodes scapularis]